MSQSSQTPTNPANNHNVSAPVTIEQLAEQLNADQSQSSQPDRIIPPLEKWHPKLSGTMDLTVKANGEWWHEGDLVTRQSLIELFSKVLWAEVDDSQQVTYFLKTPVEKWQIHVEDAPLLITQVDMISQDNKPPVLQFTTSQGDSIVADEQHPIQFGLPFQTDSVMADKQAAQPYILVRQNGESKLYGLIHRNVFYHLIELGELVESENTTTLVLKSGDSTFSLTMNNQ